MTAEHVWRKTRLRSMFVGMTSVFYDLTLKITDAANRIVARFTLSEMPMPTVQEKRVGRAGSKPSGALTATIYCPITQRVLAVVAVPTLLNLLTWQWLAVTWQYGSNQ